jgi:hypothetical protein
MDFALTPKGPSVVNVVLDSSSTLIKETALVRITPMLMLTDSWLACNVVVAMFGNNLYQNHQRENQQPKIPCCVFKITATKWPKCHLNF